MSLTAAVVFLLSVPGILAGWEVKYASEKICASEGSTVVMNCSYTYPPTIHGQTNTVEQRFWFIAKEKDLTTVSDYMGRVDYIFDNEDCTLRVRDLRQSDSANYRFRFITNLDKFTGSPGVDLTVTALQMQVTTVTVNPSSTEAELSCHSRCSHPSYVWFKNGHKVPEEAAASYTGLFNPGDGVSCALRGYEDHPSPSLYAPEFPSVLMSPPGDVVVGSSVTLTCSSGAHIAATYTWYKEDQTRLSEDPQLVLSSIQTSDSGQYYCVAENQLGKRTSEYFFVDVNYAPKLPSVSMSPPADVTEGSSVTLTCSSDANPAATYTWYKEDQTRLSEDPLLVLSSIQSSDSGQYYCVAENQLGTTTSGHISVDVKYAPKLPSVSMSPPGDVMEGSSVNLTCSSDANPAANYTWYKENQDSPIASGQTFTITDLRAEHSGIYYCEVQNTRGRRTNTFHLTVGAGDTWMLTTIGTVTAISIVGILISVLLWIRKERSSQQPAEPVEKPDGGELNQPAEQHYAVLQFSKTPADPVSSGTGPAQDQTHRRGEEEEDRVEYATVRFTSADTLPGDARRDAHRDARVDPAALYSTVIRNHDNRNHNL